ncbi:hypothetical protein BESB_026000 [Besnoitia besnoiti]|uniref:PH domain-containing protein n=1 Tax=Besnoitia besnoiti TaxID=94643 RepID=A0A2A9M6V8_BESBE|nr:uncharacterized protein BESB_026000 [Besnoitia besnoiti]PFH31626.1 hypothetical protein BESB_026000 [Besnoitia besnoiti]
MRKRHDGGADPPALPLPDSSPTQNQVVAPHIAPLPSSPPLSSSSAPSSASAPSASASSSTFALASPSVAEAASSSSSAASVSGSSASGGRHPAGTASLASVSPSVLLAESLASSLPFLPHSEDSSSPSPRTSSPAKEEAMKMHAGASAASPPLQPAGDSRAPGGYDEKPHDALLPAPDREIGSSALLPPSVTSSAAAASPPDATSLYGQAQLMRSASDRGERLSRDSRSLSRSMAQPRWSLGPFGAQGFRAAAAVAGVPALRLDSLRRNGDEQDAEDDWVEAGDGASAARASRDGEERGNATEEEPEDEKASEDGREHDTVLEFCGSGADMPDSMILGDESDEASEEAVSIPPPEGDEDSEAESTAPESLSPEDMLYEGGVHPRRRSASDDSVAALQGFNFLYTSALQKSGISCCGYLKKRSPNRFAGWQRRWFVLKDKRLLYYRQTGDRTPAGRIDLELVKIKIECLWDPRRFHGGLLCHSSSLLEPSAGSYSVASGWMELICCGSGPKGSQLVGATNDLQKEVRFRLKPVGSKRVFELAGPYAEVVEWIDKLRQVVKACNVSERDVCRVTRQRGFWKVERISPAKFEEVVDTGDIILFRTKKFHAQLQRAVTRGHYDHLGMILRSQENAIFLLESMGDTGVIMTPWRTFVQAKWYTAYRKMVLRRLRWPREQKQLDRLLVFLKNVVGRGYELTFKKLFASGLTPSADNPDKGFFCSELVAAALKEIGALPEDALCARYWPQSFAAGSNLKLCDGYELDEELMVDFCLRSAGKRRPRLRKKLEGRTVPLPNRNKIEELPDNASPQVAATGESLGVNGASFLGSAAVQREERAPAENTPLDNEL